MKSISKRATVAGIHETARSEPDQSVLSLADKSRSSERFHIRKDKTNPRRIAYLTLLMFATPPEWPLLAIGSSLVLTAILVHGWAAGYLARAGYAEREKLLTVHGPYRHVRNPYYVAQMTMDLGFFFVAGLPLFYVLYFPVIFLVYRRWVAKEERFLEAQFGDDYRTLKGEVPRWRFRLTPAAPRGSDLTFKWSTFMLNREWPRSLTHLFLLTVVGSYFFFGNPFSQIAVLTRVTGVAVIAVWLVLRDISPVDVSQKSIGWILLALSITVTAAFFLISAPVWERWSGTGAWISIVAGLFVGLLLASTAFPDLFRVVAKNSENIFARPMSQWCALGLGLGLLSCTLGGVWIGIIVPLIMWTLGIAGLVPLNRLPRRRSVGFVLLILFIMSGSLAVARELS
ncbi:MAG: methyltransferase family protein [Candidatus Binatia bacterium]